MPSQHPARFYSVSAASIVPGSSANFAAIAHLLEDVGVPRFVDLEGFAAVGADDFMHGEWGFWCWLDGYLPEHAAFFLVGLYKARDAQGNPSFAMAIKVMRVMGL